MTIEAAFSSMMPSTVTVNAVQSTDAYGKRVFAGASTSLQCRIQTTRRMVITEDGKEVPVEGTVYVYGTSVVTVNDTVAETDAVGVAVLEVPEADRYDATVRVDGVLVGEYLDLTSQTVGLTVN